LAVARGRAAGFGQHTDALVVPQGIGADARKTSQLTGAERRWKRSQSYPPGRSIYPGIVPGSSPG
jgi:hypothetical protein